MTRTPHERLVAARERAGFITRQEAIDAFHWPASAYAHHESGIRGMRTDVARKYARAYKVPVGWLVGTEPDVGELPDLATLPSDESFAAMLAVFLETALPGRVPSADLLKDVAAQLRGTLDILPKAPNAINDPAAARLLALGLAGRTVDRAPSESDH